MQTNITNIKKIFGNDRNHFIERLLEYSPDIESTEQYFDITLLCNGISYEFFGEYLDKTKEDIDTKAYHSLIYELTEDMVISGLFGGREYYDKFGDERGFNQTKVKLALDARLNYINKIIYKEEMDKAFEFSDARKRELSLSYREEKIYNAVTGNMYGAFIAYRSVNYDRVGHEAINEKFDNLIDKYFAEKTEKL